MPLQAKPLRENSSWQLSNEDRGRIDRHCCFLKQKSRNVQSLISESSQVGAVAEGDSGQPFFSILSRNPCFLGIIRDH